MSKNESDLCELTSSALGRSRTSDFTVYCEGNLRNMKKMSKNEGDLCEATLSASRRSRTSNFTVYCEENLHNIKKMSKNFKKKGGVK
jgi:hypothetical protein